MSFRNVIECLLGSRKSFTSHIRQNIYYTISVLSFAVVIAFGFYQISAHAANNTLIEPVEACVIPHHARFDDDFRSKAAVCLGWEPNPVYPICQGSYRPIEMTSLPQGQIRIQADNASLFAEGRSTLTGQVQVHESQRMVHANTAYIYRDPKTHDITNIELLGNVRYTEPDKLMFARKAVINPATKSGRVEDVLYRFHTQRAGAALPAWGRAFLIERFPNQDLLLKKVTYSTCPPKDKAWQIEADDIYLDHENSKGVAKNAVLRVQDLPLIYTPYLSFPTSKERKSGFLMPIYGYSNINGYDFGLPYYWNIAPNYDATLVPHLYTRRGVMMGGEFRFLTEQSNGVFRGDILPQDRAFGRFIGQNQLEYPRLQGLSNNRWAVLVNEHTQLYPNAQMSIDYRQVSDDYYLQDFSTNLAIATENQLLRQGDIAYKTEHWLFDGMLQSYQTLHPINQSEISDIYQRLPQLRALGSYSQLPFNLDFQMLGELDKFSWPGRFSREPQGPRYHLNPIVSLPYYRPWGYITPAVQVIENYYDIRYPESVVNQSFNRTIPRYTVDGGLFFERSSEWMKHRFTQTLEPRLYYLNVPFHDQAPIPVFDSAYMIFSFDDMFRANRFSGFDRIGDANQLTYAVTTRWLSDKTGQEKASFSVGQIRYFANRRVQLCYDREGACMDTPLMLGYISPVAKSSPVASRVQYHLNPLWVLSGDYVWDPYTNATNNGYLNLHYQPDVNKMVNFGYTYLVNADITDMPRHAIQDNALHQATISYAWPLSDRWSSLGVYSYNISKHYGMMSFLGVQYDNCCWAFRLMGGRNFKSISPETLSPQYNTSVFLQVLLKGLGSAATGSPSTTIDSYLPGYVDIFRP